MINAIKNNIVNLDLEKELSEDKDVFRKHSSVSKSVTIIQNKIIQDSNVSPLARFIICYLISLPDDWIVNYTHLAIQLRCGRDKVRILMNELIKLGYIRRTRNRLANGKMFGYVTEYSDSPIFLVSQPAPENQSLGNFLVSTPGADFTEAGENRLPANPSLQITTTLPCLKNKDHKNNNNNNNNTPREKDVVVVLKKSLDEIQLNKIEIPKLSSEAKKWGINYLLEKLIVCKEAKKIDNLDAFFWKAVRDDFKPKGSLTEISEKLKPFKPKHTKAGNQAWWQTLSDEQKHKAVELAFSKGGTYPDFFKTLCGTITITDKKFHEHAAFGSLMEQIGRDPK